MGGTLRSSRKDWVEFVWVYKGGRGGGGGGGGRETDRQTDRQTETERELELENFILQGL